MSGAQKKAKRELKMDPAEMHRWVAEMHRLLYFLPRNRREHDQNQ